MTVALDCEQKTVPRLLKWHKTYCCRAGAAIFWQFAKDFANFCKFVEHSLYLILHVRAALQSMSRFECGKIYRNIVKSAFK